MKILIVPMAAMAETKGSIHRCELLAKAFIKAGCSVIVGAARDVNYRKVEGAKEYEISIPMPLGFPAFIAKRTFPLAEAFGITRKKSVNSFEDVLHLTGNSNYHYIKKSVTEIAEIIKAEQPDAVYSEFNLSAMIAAKMLNIPLYITASMPTQSAYASTPVYAKEVNRFFREISLQQVNSILEVFDYAKLMFIPSCQLLEPLLQKNVIFTGAWNRENFSELKPNTMRSCIVVYMGNGTISKKRMIKEVSKAFFHSEIQVYIAGESLAESNDDNIHIASSFPFDKLLKKTLVMIHHGGQNSMIDACLCGVPQLICPGKVFERKYNAAAIEKCGAGIQIKEKNFNASDIRTCVMQMINDERYYKSAEILREKLLCARGTDSVAEEILKQQEREKSNG